MPPHLFRSEDLADVDLTIKLAAVNANGKRLRDDDSEVLLVFPAHKAILDESGYLRVQVSVRLLDLLIWKPHMRQ
jgi:hypothetical protein